MSIFTPEITTLNVDRLRAAGVLEKAGIIKPDGNWRFVGYKDNGHYFYIEQRYYKVDLSTMTYIEIHA